MSYGGLIAYSEEFQKTVIENKGGEAIVYLHATSMKPIGLFQSCADQQRTYEFLFQHCTGDSKSSG